MSQIAFDALFGVVDQVFAIDEPTAQRAKEIVLERPGLSARDALHTAVMDLQGIEAILSFDAGFDDLPASSDCGEALSAV